MDKYYQKRKGQALYFSFLLTFLLLINISQVGASSYKDNTDLFDKTIKARTLVDEYYGKGSNLTDAAFMLNEIVKIDKNYVPAYIEMARVVIKGGYIVNLEFRGGTMETAYFLLNEAVNINPDYADTHVLLGHLYTLVGNLSQAELILNKAKQLGSSNPWLNNNIAHIFYQRKDYIRAKNKYEEIVSKGPGNTSQHRNSYIDALEKLMNIAYQYSNDEELLFLAKTAVESTSKDNAWTWGNAGNLLCREGFFKTGIEYNRKALSIMEYGVAKGNLAFCLYGRWAELISQDKQADAEKYFYEAYTINPNIKAVAIDFSGSGDRLKSLRKIFDEKIRKLEHSNVKKSST